MGDHMGERGRGAEGGGGQRKGSDWIEISLYCRTPDTCIPPTGKLDDSTQVDLWITQSRMTSLVVSLGTSNSVRYAFRGYETSIFIRQR